MEDDRFTYDATVLSGDVPSDESMHTATLLIDSTGPVDYQKAAAQEYQKLLAAWAYVGGEDEDVYEHKMMWYQGNAMDTLIDYVAITQDPKKGAELGEKVKTVWKTAGPHGAWWDDFGWWGVAFLNAARNFKILAQESDTEYMNNAEDCLQENKVHPKKLYMDQAATVWEMATTETACQRCLDNPPANWYRFEPRFSGGVWNSSFAGLNTGPQASCKPSDSNMPLGTPEDDCSLLNPLQNTVTNGLYLVLNARYCLQKKDVSEDRKNRALAIYGWFKNWMDLADDAITLCKGYKTRPSLINAETGLLRERVGIYANKKKDAESDPATPASNGMSRTHHGPATRGLFWALWWI